MKIENIQGSSDNLESTDVQPSAELPEEVEELLENNCLLAHKNSDETTTQTCEFTPGTIGQKLWRISISFDESRKKRRSSSSCSTSRKR